MAAYMRVHAHTLSLVGLMLLLLLTSVCPQKVNFSLTISAGAGGVGLSPQYTQRDARRHSEHHHGLLGTGAV